MIDTLSTDETADSPPARFASTAVVCLALGTVLTAIGCASSSSPHPPTGPRPPIADPEIVDLELRALLLLQADRRSYERLAVGQALDGDAELRRQTALAVARAGDPRGGGVLELLLGDEDPMVRRAAAFALGELGEQGYDGTRALLGAAVESDGETGRLAVEALAKLGVPLAPVATKLGEVGDDERLVRLTPWLFRFDDDGVVAWAERALAVPELHAMAAYGLAREPRPQGLELLRDLVGDPDPWVRGLAARGLGRVGDGSDVDRLRPLIDDPEPGPIVQALRSARRLVASGAAAPPADWRPRLLELFSDPRPGVRLMAIEASTVWLLDDELGSALAELARSELRRERELAILALAEAGDSRAASLAARAATDLDPVLRRRAAEAAGFLGASDVLVALADDEDPGVRRTVLETRLAAAPSNAVDLVLAALEDPDPTLRSAALDWAADNPVIGRDELFGGMAGHWRDTLPDARLSGVRAFAARAEAEPAERESIVAWLDKLAREDRFLVRRAAGQALRRLGEEAPAVGSADGRRTVEAYRDVVRRTVAPRRVDLITERGTVRLELACAEAPLTCLNFLQLGAQGFYDGLTFHRVVPDFVVQAGDPRGDGAGGPGYELRDEIGRVRYDTGVLGMARAGPDTAGSQFFITLAPQPHLDGGYTAFGRVVAGEEVLHQIVQGDSIVGVVEVP